MIRTVPETSNSEYFEFSEVAKKVNKRGEDEDEDEDEISVPEPWVLQHEMRHTLKVLTVSVGDYRSVASPSPAL